MSLNNNEEMKPIQLTKVKGKSGYKKICGNDDIDMVYKVEEFPEEVADKGEYEENWIFEDDNPNFIMLYSLLLQQEMQRTLFIITMILIMIKIVCLVAILLMRRRLTRRLMMVIAFK